MVKTTVKIDGMMCGMCESHINDVIRRTFPQAKKVSSSHRTGEASFLTDEPVNGDILEKAVEDTGYHYGGYKTEPYEKHGLFSKGR